MDDRSYYKWIPSVQQSTWWLLCLVTWTKQASSALFSTCCQSSWFSEYFEPSHPVRPGQQDLCFGVMMNLPRHRLIKHTILAKYFCHLTPNFREITLNLSLNREFQKNGWKKFQYKDYEIRTSTLESYQHTTLGPINAIAIVLVFYSTASKAFWTQQTLRYMSTLTASLRPFK